MVSLVDGALHHLGKPGGFHLLVAILLCCNFFPITFHHMSMVFYGESIPHTCRLPEGWPWHKKFSIPKVTSGIQSKYDACHMFVDPNSAALGTKSCVYGWEFYPQGREWTIIAEWGLVCEREYLVTLAAVVYHGGVMFGGLVFGTLADKFGRKPLMLFTLYAQTAISIGLYFVQNFILFVILRFVHGLLLQGLQCSTICLVMELLPMRYRTAAGMGCSIVWGLGMISLSLVSYSVQHWRYIQLAISLPCIVTFLYIWLIPESVRWLLTVMKTEKALLTAQKFEQFNKRPLGENFSKDVETATKQVPTNAGQVESYGMRELLLQGSKLRISSLVLCFCWFATSSLYHGLSLMLLEVGSNRYTSMVIIGSVDLVAFIVMYFLLVRFGRKRPICALLVLCGAVCISTVVAENLEVGHTLEVYVVSTVLTLVERSCAAACLAGLTICAAELFPTVIRTFGIGVCLFCGQFGWLMAPQILKLSQFSLKALPWITFGILSLLAGLLILLLPETLTKSLPDTLEDMENFESRKAAVISKDKEAAKPPSYGQDWATTYKQKIEEANGNLSTMESEDHKEVQEKRWYARNYSRRSAKVVRFYGLDCSEDPCQEVKTSKKQRIRMVRFSFESEELPSFRVTSCAPLSVGRFSAIQEEPELETSLDEDTAESSLDEEKEEDFPTHPVGKTYPVNNCAAAKTVDILSVLDAVVENFPPPAVEPQPVLDLPVDNAVLVEPDTTERQPRFVVQRVPDPQSQDALLQDATSVLPQNDHPIVAMEKQSRFVVHRVVEASSQSLQHRPNEAVESNSFEGSSVGTPTEATSVEKRSRFLVQKVVERPSANGLDVVIIPAYTTADSKGSVEGCCRAIAPVVTESNNAGIAASGVMRLTNESPFLEKKSRFLVQKVMENPIFDSCRTTDVNSNVSECSSGAMAQPFVVQKVLEMPVMNDLQKTDGSIRNASECSPGTATVSLADDKLSRFVVQRVREKQELNLQRKTTDSNSGVYDYSAEITDASLANGKSSRFVVQKVQDFPALQSDQKITEANGNLGECSSETQAVPLMNGESLRFVVQKVKDVPALQSDQKVTEANSNLSKHSSEATAVSLMNGKSSQFVVQTVQDIPALQSDQKTTEANSNLSKCSSETTAVPLMNGKSSRFVVQKVQENSALHGVQKAAPPNSNAGEFGPATMLVPQRFWTNGVQKAADENSNVKDVNSGTPTIPLVNGKSRFVVQKLSENLALSDIRSSADANGKVNEHESGTAAVPLVDGKPSRFTVRRVSDSKLLQPGSQLISHSTSNNCKGVEAVNGTNANVPSQPPIEQKSRFLVQRVTEDVLKVVHLNNNNNISIINNRNNNDQKLPLEKMLEGSNAPQGPFSQDECENIENVQQVALTNGNSPAVSIDLDGGDGLKRHLKYADVATNS